MTQETEAATQAGAALARIIRRAIDEAGGWIGFDRFMSMALYTPGLGYYAGSRPKFGLMPDSGSDFVTAPELSPLFGRALAMQVGEALDATGTDEVWEFGAGSGALAAQLLEALGARARRYTIVDLSGSLRERQAERLAAQGDRVRWVDRLPDRFEGVVVGNEVLDAMPVQLLVRRGGVWHERGVVWQDGAFAWSDRPTDLRPPLEPAGTHDYLTETHAQARAFVATLADRLVRGAVFLVDYGFPEHEYYHPQRSMGTLVCHRAHRTDDAPLVSPGEKDITAHVDFTGVALTGQAQGLHVLGYTSQARFLFNCGLGPLLEAESLPVRAQALRLVSEHEMGELFKVIGFAAGEPWDACGFAAGDRSHTL